MDDGLLSTLITAASRAWDRICTGVPDAENYFYTEDVSGEILEGQIYYTGDRIICYPHKPIINSVSSFTFQKNIVSTAYTVDPTRIECVGPRVVAYPESMGIDFPSKCRVTINYNGGLSSGSAPSTLPDDMQEAVAILAVRFYREAETGLADQMGVAELGTMVYTKALPVRVATLAEFYRRKVGWRHVS